MEKYLLERCRICNSKVTKFLSLGGTHPPEEFRRKSELGKKIVTFPLGLSYCPNCGQVQLSYEIPPDVIYKQNYFYEYSITKQSDTHYTGLANEIMGRYGLTKNDLVVDVGSNTGKLLWIFQNMGTRILGVDPATKLVRIARKNGIPTIDAYFGEPVAKRIVKKYGKAKAITANNVFDHVTDLYAFMKGIRVLLDYDGVFVIEVPYFETFVKTLNHVIYHQQLDYVLLKVFRRLFDANGMEIIDCEKIPYHGGSVRIFTAFRGEHRVSEHVAQFIREEEETFKDQKKTLRKFAHDVLAQRDDLAKLLKKLKAQGKSIAATGASAKGNVLLFYSGIGPETIDFITEKSKLKIGRYTPLGIPIVKQDVLFKKKPDYAVNLAWNFNEEILAGFRDYIKAGGKFIIPIPKLRVVP